MAYACSAKVFAEKTMNQVIAVDFDDVIFDCNATLVEFHNARYGTTLKVDDVRSWNLEQVWGCTLDEAIRRVNEYLQTDFHDSAPLIAGAHEGLLKLKTLGYSIILVTSRADDVRPQTEAWIKKNIAGLFSDMYFINHFDASTPKHRSKADVCKEINAGVLIEDAVHHAENVAGSNIPVLLFDQPWNRTEMGPNIVRVKSWSEVVDWVQKKLPI